MRGQSNIRSLSLLASIAMIATTTLFGSSREAFASVGTPSGSGWAWGDNYSGQLGNNSTTNSSVPVQVSNLSGVVAIAGGREYHSLALKSDGTVWAWGINGDGQLGNNSTTNSSVPVQVSNLSGVVAIAGGEYYSLALKSDGTAWDWGTNTFGELGNNSTTESHVPVQVSNLSGVVAIAGGGGHSLALKSDGTVWAWGRNDDGELGNNSTTDSRVPVQVSNLSSVVAIAGGDRHSIALRSDGAVWAWGYNYYGELGNNSTTNSSAPVQVGNLSSVVAIAGGAHHSLALKSDGTVWAWGINGGGELGNNSTTDSHVPVQVSDLSGVVAISCGYYHSLALKSDGTVWDWGANYYGQLGNNSTTESHVPVQVSNLSGVVAIAGGGAHSLALRTDTMTFSINAPSPSDQLLYRGLNVFTPASASPVHHYLYWWTSDLSLNRPAPDLQHPEGSTAGVNPTVSFSDAWPDQDWKLFVQAVYQDGASSTWVSQVIHTPKQPILVALGDSVTAGYHHEDGESSTTCSDGSYAYGSKVKARLDGRLPPQWSVSYSNLAYAGFALGPESGTNRGSLAKNGDVMNGGLDSPCNNSEPSPLLSAEAMLSSARGSWNRVVITGGINDTNWVDVIQGTVVDYLTPALREGLPFTTDDVGRISDRGLDPK